jgi:hypothetical protein
MIIKETKTVNIYFSYEEPVHEYFWLDLNGFVNLTTICRFNLENVYSGWDIVNLKSSLDHYTLEVTLEKVYE